MPDDIDDDFKKKNAKTLSVRRGAGLWLWKPYVILKALNELAEEGDTVFYSDAGAFFIRSFLHIQKSMKEDIWVSDIPLAEKQYTKRETFVLMECEGKEYEDTAQVQATFVCVRKTDATIAFIKKWLDYCTNYRILSPEHNEEYPEDSCFISHREDQSVLSLLCKKYGIKAHQDPTQYGRFPEKLKRPENTLVVRDSHNEYPVVLILHRQPVVAYKHILFQYMHTVLPKRIVRLFLSKEYYS